MDFWTLVLVGVLILLLVQIIKNVLEARRPPPPPATFHLGDVTLESLRYYNGSNWEKPTLIAVCGKIYDVTDCDQYGPGKARHPYAGRECSRALALGSMEESDLVDDLTGLSDAERATLQQEVQDLETSAQAVVGKVVPLRLVPLAELAAHDGSDPSLPIWLAIRGKVFDVSKGRAFYGPGGAYPFAGKECARALALMSTSEEELGRQDTDDLGSYELTSLRDWEEKFRWKYPVLGSVAGDKEGPEGKVQ